MGVEPILTLSQRARLTVLYSRHSAALVLLRISLYTSYRLCRDQIGSSSWIRTKVAAFREQGTAAVRRMNKLGEGYRLSPAITILLGTSGRAEFLPTVTFKLVFLPGVEPGFSQ